MTTQKILLIGNGRLARHLVRWYSLNLKSHDNHNTNRTAITRWFRSPTVQGAPTDSAQELSVLSNQLNSLSSEDVIWLAISDQAIIPFYESQILSSKCKARVVHFSGALYDPRLFGAHPLMTFPQAMLPDEVYPKIHFAIDFAHVESAHNSTPLEFSKLLPGFRNSWFEIKPEQKAYYHALCVAAGNLPQFLWALTEREFQKLNVPVGAQSIYIHQVAENFTKLGAAGITGPIIRKDQKTIQAHLDALAREQSKIFEIYQAIYSVVSATQEVISSAHQSDNKPATSRGSL